MDKGPKRAFFAGLTLIVGLGLMLAAVALSQDSSPSSAVVAASKGGSKTLLPDGSWLLLGGSTPAGVTATAAIVDSQSEIVTPLATHLEYARAWHTATLLSNGTVVILGGVGRDGKTVTVTEEFDPATQAFSELSTPGITPRSHHTATLLSDGTVLIVGGLSANNTTLGGAQIWNPLTNQVTAVAGGLNTPRYDQTATLQADGNVLIEGGIDAQGNRLTSSEVFDSKLETFSSPPASAETAVAADATPQVAASLPANETTGVPVTTVISARFSQPMEVETLTSNSVVLAGPDGTVTAMVVPAEAGMLAFVNPAAPLAPGVTYTVTLSGAVGADGIEMPTAAFSFTTASTNNLATSSPNALSSASSEFGANGVWIPTSDWRTHLPPSRWQSLPPLMPHKGVTALSGQVLTLSGNPLAFVTLGIGTRVVMTDATGRFLLTAVPAGKSVLKINGTTANGSNRSYGIFEVGVSIQSHVTNLLGYTIWMPVLDMAHAVTLPSPTKQATVITNPLMPGLALHLAAGTVISDDNGTVVHTVSSTPVPLDRPPFPLPIGVNVPIYFTLQPGGAWIKSWTSGGYGGAQLYYPNAYKDPPGTPYAFWNYNPDNWGWYVYGNGTVSADGSAIVPDPGVEIYEFSGAMVGGPSLAPGSPNPAPPPDPNGPPPGCPQSADPVDCSTGIFFENHTDISLKDVIPLTLTRTYRTADSRSRPFGIGATDNYEIFLVGNYYPYTYMDLILPDGARVYYPRTSSGTGYGNAVYQNTTAPGPYYGSIIAWNGTGWSLTLKDGTVYTFPDSYLTSNPALAAATSITDRDGNKVTINRDSSGNITTILSPDYRWLAFQHDSSNRITQVTDNAGRTVTYTYDNYSASGRATCSSTGMLCAVTDANGGVTSYTYDSSDRMLTMTDPRANVTFTNQYNTAGRVSQQTLADGTSTYQFSYTTDSNGNVTQTSITDPNGVVEQKNFTEFYDSGSSNYTGFMTSDVAADGDTEQQTTTYTRDSSTNKVTMVTDQLGRETAYYYDALGNVTSITSLYGTADAVTTSYTYDPVYNQLTSVTDPLSHQWTLSRDSHGNLTGVTDPLGHSISITYAANGQPLTVADAAGDTAHFAYSLGDLTAVTDPLGHATSLFADAAGRTVSVTDPAGDQTLFAYDPLDRLTQITDATGHTTSFGYDGNGNLTSVTDAGSNATTYTYDARNQRTAREDALTNSESYQYDANGNLTQFTDRRGKVTVYQYDHLNRRTFIGYGYTGSSYESTISNTWDGGDRLTAADDSIAGTIDRSYDGLDRLTEEQSPQGDVVYTYDNASRRSTMAVTPAGTGATTVNYGYQWDNANRLTGVIQGTGSTCTACISYDSANRRTTLGLPNGVTVSYSYDNDSRVTQLSYGTSGSGSSNLGTLTYSYDGDGRVTAKGGSLAAVNLPSAASGNTFNVDNAMTAFNGTTLSYDLNGNLTGDGTNTYTWDARNHLGAISGGVAATFVYDPFGRRASKTIGGTTTQFLYDGLNPAQELSAGSSPSVNANLMTGLGIDEYFTRTDSSSNVSTFLADTLGSTIGLVGSSGSIATSYTYEPFGNTTAAGSSNGNAFQFTGRENDATGLYFYRSRYYSPTLQRFLAQDPIGFRGGLNVYAYDLNDPVDFGDPTGFCANQPQNPGCGAALGELGIGLLGTALTVGPAVAAPMLAPELFEGIEGLAALGKMSIIGVPGLLLIEQGFISTYQYCL